MRDKIITELSGIEKLHNIKILYAVESGSRAWGFASATSDYDVRFLYISDIRRYLDIDSQRDTIEIFKDNKLLDFSGWDFRKTLKLFQKGNPHLMEWLYSPIVYCDRYGAADKLRKLASGCFNQTASIYHYLHMSERNYNEYINNSQIRVKRYFYVLRTIFACRWILKHNSQPPVRYSELFDDIELPSSLRLEIEKLFRLRISLEEDTYVDKVKVMDEYILSQLELLRAYDSAAQCQTAASADLNDIFIDTLSDVWGLASTLR
jgi:predicted nucleotidyltransferase